MIFYASQYVYIFGIDEVVYEKKLLNPESSSVFSALFKLFAIGSGLLLNGRLISVWILLFI